MSIFEIDIATKNGKPINMKRAKQFGFELLERKNVKYFGGAYLKNSNPKEKRPVSTKRCMHLVLRSLKAKAEFSFLRRDQKIKKIIGAQAVHFGVKIYRMANGGNHLHLIILPRSREAFKGFIRSISGLIARTVLHAEKGNAKNLRFWDKRPFTRIIEWGREYRTVCRYLLQNTLEALGFIPYQPRNHPFKFLNSTA